MAELVGTPKLVGIFDGTTGHLIHDPGDDLTATGQCGRPGCTEPHRARIEWDSDGTARVVIPSAHPEG
jgi:hypothetical protein